MSIVLKTLSLGCGIQSSTIAEMIVEGELPRVDFAIFSDTGDEPSWVYDQRDYLQGRLESVDIPLVTVQNESIIDAIYRSKGRFASIPAYTLINSQPGMMRRQCTREYKIEPIEKFVRRELLKRDRAKETKSGAIRINSGAYTETWIGISLDESLRMRDNQVKAFKNIWPLIDLRMTRLDCVNWLKSKGLPVPNKSSCRICPFHSKTHWRNIKENHPKDWAHVVAVDKYLRTDNNFTARTKGEMFLYRECIPLDEVDFEADDLQTDFFEMCDGYCFI